MQHTVVKGQFDILKNVESSPVSPQDGIDFTLYKAVKQQSGDSGEGAGAGSGDGTGTGDTGSTTGDGTGAGDGTGDSTATDTYTKGDKIVMKADDGTVWPNPQTTANGGKASFKYLMPGTYILEEDTSTVPQGCTVYATSHFDAGTVGMW